MTKVINQRIYDNIANIGIDEIKTHIGIYNDNSEDDILTTYLDSAYDMASQYLGYPINPVVYQMALYDTGAVAIDKSTHTRIRDIEVKFYNKDQILVKADKKNLSIDLSDQSSVLLRLDLQEERSATVKYPLSITYTEEILKGNISRGLISALIVIVGSLYDASSDGVLNNAAKSLLDELTENIV